MPQLNACAIFEWNSPTYLWILFSLVASVNQTSWNNSIMHIPHVLYILVPLFSLCVSQTMTSQCTENKSELIAALQRYFSTGCVFLVYLEKKTNSDIFLSKLIHLQTLLTTQYIATATLFEKYFSDTVKNYICQKNKPLFVILSNGEDTKKQLQEMFATLITSQQRWLLFLDDASSLSEVLGKVFIPFDCEFLVASGCNSMNLIEVYKLTETHLLQSVFWGEWNSEDGLQTPKLPLYSRRNNLQGIRFNAAVLHHPPFVYVKNIKELKFDTLRGIIPLIFQGMSRELNFSVVLTRVPENYYGNMISLGKWNGAIGMVIEDKVNLTLNAFHMTAQRLQVVDFAAPLRKTGTCIFIRSTYNSDVWGKFLAPFAWSLWLAVGCSILVTASWLSLLHLLECRENPPKPGFYLRDYFFFVWGIFCIQSYWVTPHRCYGRLVHWTAFVTALLVLASYSANFISFLSVQEESLPFTNLQGLLEDGTYAFGVIETGAFFQRFQDATDGTMKTIFKKKLSPMKGNLPETPLQAFEQTCKQKFAFMGTCHDLIYLHSQIPCSLSVLQEHSSQIFSSVVLPKDSQFKRIFNIYFQKVIRHGLFQRMHNTFIPNIEVSDPKPPRSVGISDIVLLLSLCALGSAIGGMVLLIEMCILKWKTKNKEDLKFIFPYTQ